MSINQSFIQIQLTDLLENVSARKGAGCAFVQILAVNTEHGIDLIYSFRKDGVLENLKISGVGKEDTVPSITEMYLASFVFENEIHDLFGVRITDIAIDFGGNFYALSQMEPMTIISPEQKAARDKAAKIAAAKAAKAAKGNESASSDGKDAELESKLANMDPEKAAKVRAAMEAKKKKEQEAKLAELDPEKAAKVKAALEAKAKREAEKAASEKGGE